MNEVSLYKNMKRWCFLYGDRLLDLLFPVQNPDTNKPTERYVALPEMFDKHFNLLAYYASQLQPIFPLVLVEFERTDDKTCFATYKVRFHIYFQTVSPRDCKDNEVVICNSPECILQFKQSMTDALYELMCRMGDDLRHEVFDNQCWEYPLDYELTEFTENEIQGVPKDEILYFNLEFEVSDNESCC